MHVLSVSGDVLCPTRVRAEVVDSNCDVLDIGGGQYFKTVCIALGSVDALFWPQEVPNGILVCCTS